LNIDLYALSLIKPTNDLGRGGCAFECLKEGIRIDIPIFLKEIFNPAKDLVGLGHKADFMSIEVIKGVRIHNVHGGRRGSKLNVAESFMDGGK
jgi:hypothetical protein